MIKSDRRDCITGQSQQRPDGAELENKTSDQSDDTEKRSHDNPARQSESRQGAAETEDGHVQIRSTNQEGGKVPAKLKP
jgi:hypothetical protein